MKRGFVLVATFFSMLPCSTLWAQSIYATVTGVVSDPASAVIPNAAVRLKNEQSGSLRETTTNSDGYFTFASVGVGDFTYELTVEAKGFQIYKANGIALNGGEKRNINVALSVGSTTEVVEVSDTASIVP